MKDGIITADGDFVRLYDDWVWNLERNYPGL